MPAYLVVDSQLTDPEHYEQYKLRAKPIVEQFGGEYLARGGGDGGQFSLGHLTSDELIPRQRLVETRGEA